MLNPLNLRCALPPSELAAAPTYNELVDKVYHPLIARYEDEYRREPGRLLHLNTTKRGWPS